jgi:hypothetical protein
VSHGQLLVLVLAELDQSVWVIVADYVLSQCIIFLDVTVSDLVSLNVGKTVNVVLLSLPLFSFIVRLRSFFSQKN